MFHCYEEQNIELNVFSWVFHFRAIIFCRTKIDCDNLERYLREVGGQRYSCVCLHGDRKPHERKANLQSFKDEKAKFLICTDVAARGLDITGLPFSKIYYILNNLSIMYFLFLFYFFSFSDQCYFAWWKIQLCSSNW